MRTARRLRSFPLRCFSFLLVVVGLPCVAPNARAQTLPTPIDQTTPFAGAGHDYIHLLSETVNPATGQVSVRIQLPTAQGRGLSLPAGIAYDSDQQYFLYPGVTGGTQVYNVEKGDLSQAGWRYTLPELSFSDFSIRGQTPGGYNATCNASTRYTFSD